VAARLSDTEDAAQSVHTRADAIETKAGGAAANHQGLVNRVDTLDADITNQFVLVNTYVGDVEAKADTNADDLTKTAADVASNTKDIASLRGKDVEIDGKLAGLESSRATRDELTEAVEDFERQLQAEAADIRVLQDEMGTKVIQLTDQTTEHNSFINDMQANIAALGNRVDSNDADITSLKQTRLTQAQVEGVVATLLTPVEAKATKIESDVAQLRKDLNAIDLKPLEKQIATNTIAARLGASLGPGKTLTETQAFNAAKAYCASKNNGFDEDKVECKECTGGQVDEKGRCLDTNLAFTKLTKSLSR
jgi:chromosome segregation ATPase